jgi:hypothetical protein
MITRKGDDFEGFLLVDTSSEVDFKQARELTKCSSATSPVWEKPSRDAGSYLGAFAKVTTY